MGVSENEALFFGGGGGVLILRILLFRVPIRVPYFRKPPISQYEAPQTSKQELGRSGMAFRNTEKEPLLPNPKP